MDQEDAVATAELNIRVQTLEREIAEMKRYNEQHRDNDSRRWDDLLVRFGELKAKVEGLNGRMAGYVVAGSILSGGLALLAQVVMGKGN
jgi:hypothetical protein